MRSSTLHWAGPAALLAFVAVGSAQAGTIAEMRSHEQHIEYVDARHGKTDLADTVTIQPYHLLERAGQSFKDNMAVFTDTLKSNGRSIITQHTWSATISGLPGNPTVSIVVDNVNSLARNIVVSGIIARSGIYPVKLTLNRTDTGWTQTWDAFVYCFSTEAWTIRLNNQRIKISGYVKLTVGAIRTASNIEIKVEPAVQGTNRANTSSTAMGRGTVDFDNRRLLISQVRHSVSGRGD
ncbi:MAG: hypothetical protein ABSG53_28680 [Thermoguttaceae bacterium]|jgi:hypothetical protein